MHILGTRFVDTRLQTRSKVWPMTAQHDLQRSCARTRFHHLRPTCLQLCFNGTRMSQQSRNSCLYVWRLGCVSKTCKSYCCRSASVGRRQCGSRGCSGMASSPYADQPPSSSKNTATPAPASRCERNTLPHGMRGSIWHNMATKMTTGHRLSACCMCAVSRP